MSAKRKFKRHALRVVGDDEAAFRETMGMFGAFMKLGFRTNDIQVGMLPSPKNVGHAISPVVIVKQGERALTYRLDNHELAGTQEAVESRWRAWVGELMGTHDDVPRHTFDSMFQATRFAQGKALDSLKDTLRNVGISLAAWSAEK